MLLKGEYLSFLDINNFFDKNFFEELINRIDKSPPDILIYRYELYNETSNLFYKDNYSYEEIWPNITINYTSLPKKLFNTFGLCIWNKMFKLSFIKNNHLFFNNNSESCLLFMDFSLIKADKINTLDKTVIFYNTTLIDRMEIKKDILGIYSDLIELKSIFQKENIFNVLSGNYKQHELNVNIKIINQIKNYLYIDKELKEQ